MARLTRNDPFLSAIIAGVLAVVAFMVAAAIFGPMIFGAESPAHHSGGVTVSLQRDATVVHDPWCERSEDSCAINFRASGAWTIRRVTP